MENTMVYLVYKCKGSWDDYYSWVDRVYLDKDKAEEYSTKYNLKLYNLKERITKEAKFEEEWNTPINYRYLIIMEYGDLIVRECKLY